MLNRELQLKLLKKLSSEYPDYYDLSSEYIHGTHEYKEAVNTLYYLLQHGLVEERSLLISNASDGLKRLQFNLPTINQNGMDFLADDGGLSAILRAVTVKFDAEQIKAILSSKILASDLKSADKQKLLDGLRVLPSESIKHLTMKVLDLGWDNLGSLIRIIQSNLL